MANFTEKVYKITALIPRGHVSTYQAIARALKNSHSSRAVGNALNKNPYAPKVPCHRVIRSNGQVGGFARGSAKKTDMLRKEGVAVKNGRIDLKNYLYEPKFKK